jgi:PAS domain S-box-containing protein
MTIEQSNLQYIRGYIEASEAPLFFIGTDGLIANLNGAGEELIGHSQKQLLGTDLSQQFTNPEKATDTYKRILKEGLVKSVGLKIKNKKGKNIDVTYSGSIFTDDKEKVQGVFVAVQDITKVRQASQQYARSLIEASVDPLVTISPDGKITDVNSATIEATGVIKEELVGSIFSDYFTEPEKAESGYKKVLKEGIVRDYPLTIKHKNGKLMDVLYNASVYKDGKGNVLGVFAAARDITKQKQASQYARSLIEASLDPLVTISPNGKITDVNSATIEATGLSKVELIGSIFSDYFTEPERAESGYKKVLKEGFVRDYSLTIKHKNGKLMDVLYNASVYKDGKGNVLGVFAAARDITKQKQASQYARSLIEASLDPLVTISLNGKITDVNSATIEVTGMTKKELIGSDFSLYFTEPDKAREGYQEAFKKGEVRDYLLTIRSKIGKITPVLYNASVYKDEKGKVLGVFAAAREIGKSELKSARARELQRVSKRTIFKVVLGRKLGKGSVKISERDAMNLRLDIVDNVNVKPTREDLSGKKIIAMSMTSTRIPSGTIVVSPGDFRNLGLEEDDTVFIIKANADEEPTLVDIEQYGAQPGEYEIPGLEISEEEEKEFKGEKKELAEKKIFEKEGTVSEEKAKEEAYKENELREKGEKMAEDEGSTAEKEQKEEQPEEQPEEEPEEGDKKQSSKKTTEKQPKNNNPKKKSEKDFESQIDALRNS